MTDEIIIVKSNLHESNITNTNMTSFVSTTTSSSSATYKNTSSNNVVVLPLLHEHETHDVDENIIIKTQNNISNKDDVEAAISNSNNNSIKNIQKLLIDNSHQHQILPSQQQQQHPTEDLNAYNNCTKQDCATNLDKLTQNRLFPYEKCLSSTTKYKANKKFDQTTCKKLINLSKISKSDSCLHEKVCNDQRTLTASHECWNNFTNNQPLAGECCDTLYY